jgi:hypothetical protein
MSTYILGQQFRLSISGLLFFLIVVQIFNCRDASAEPFVAIAFSKYSKAEAYATDNRKYIAEQKANKKCEEIGQEPCSTIILFENSCGALVTGKFGWGVGWSQQNKDDALSKALRNCEGKCKLRRWVCNSQNGNGSVSFQDSGSFPRDVFRGDNVGNGVRD